MTLTSVHLQIPEELLRRVEEARAATDTARNAWIRRAIEMRLAVEAKEKEKS